MKTHRKLGLVAITAFLMSFFLPAYNGDSGFACFGECWNMFLGHDVSGRWFYYSGFVISNILFIGLVAALFVTKKSRRFTSVISIVCLLQVMSWLVLNVILARPSQIAEINIGYYVWFAAHGLLVAAHLWKMTPSNKVTGANSHPTSPFATHCLERRTPMAERRWHHHGGAAVAQF